MGLCKCPKKKVTNQFCFEHRVNVCEHCIVADHTKCIVQSYLQWLNDSEYSPKCALCKNPLEDQPCTRLVCYDVFHSACLASWGASHPSHTAPAGFKCPVCGAAVFPAPQLASPVALALKQTLATWDWARKTMGLSADSSNHTWISANGAVTELQNGTGVAGSAATATGSTVPPPNIPTHSFTSSSTTAKVSPSATSNPAANSASTASVGVASSTHRKASSSDSHSLNVMEESDTDDNKYKRRPVLTWFKRWWRSYQPLSSSGGGRAGGRRRCLALLGILLLTTLLLLLARARSSSFPEGRLDPVFDPLNNPNIHVQEAD